MKVNFSKNFVALRKKYGFTQERIAEKCGVSRQAITKWEAGSSLPDMYKLVEIADVFNVSIDELISGDINYNMPETDMDDKKFSSIMEKLKEIKASIQRNRSEDDDHDDLYEEYLYLQEYPDSDEIDSIRDYLGSGIEIIPEYLEAGFDKAWAIIKELILIERGSFPEVLSHLYDLSSVLYENEYNESCPDNKYISFIELVAEIMPIWARILKNEIELERQIPGRFAQAYQISSY